MKNIDYFKPITIMANGRVETKIKPKNLIPPFTVVLLPLKNGLRTYEQKIEKDQKLIYFKKVFGKIELGTNKNEIIKILYCIGKEKNNIKKVIWINPITLEEKEVKGKNIEL